MTDLRKRALMELIDMRRRLEVLIQDLSGDPEHREFVRKYSNGETIRVRELRPYDLPPVDAEEIMRIHGISDSDTPAG